MEILNSYPVLEYRNGSLLTFLILIIFFSIFFALLIMSLIDAEYAYSCVFSIFAFIFIVLIIYCGRKVPSGRSEYQVILSDNYSAKDLYKNYEVIKTEGKIWYIRDKEKKDENIDDK